MKIVYTYLLLCVALVVFSQDKPENVLFTINDKPYLTDEFVRVYNKNLSLVKDESQQNIDNYLEMFIAYKLKVIKAKQLGLDQTEKFKNELRTYKSQLASPYLVDKKVTKELVEEAYQRMKQEVKASHILITLDEYASPADTLKAYNEIKTIKSRIEKGESFEDLAVLYSKDPSAKTNKGSLGYFSVFKMVYPFESAAFNTPVGQISEPFRTKFGYHIIQVKDKRANKGQVSVAHIMFFKAEKDTLKGNPKTRADEIYAKLQQGEDFASLAKMHSDDKGSSVKGGELEAFGSGDVGVEEFENQAFSIEKENNYTKPFETEYGWHIIKLLKKEPVKSFEDLSAYIEKRVGSDDRSILIKNSLLEKLRVKYKVITNQKVLNAIAKNVDNTYYEGKWKSPEFSKTNETILATLDGVKISNHDFYTYLEAQQRFKIGIKPLSKLVSHLYEKYIDERLNLYYNDNLEIEFPEFKSIMNDYREGIMLFDLMEKEIWNKAKIDTLGLSKYYDIHKEKYKSEDRYELKIISSSNPKIIKKAKSYIKKGKQDDYIKKKLNNKRVVNVVIESGVFDKNSTKLPFGYTFVKGISDVYEQNGYYYVIENKAFTPSAIQPLEAVKGRVVSDYQQVLEKQFIQDLKNEFKVYVDLVELNRVKAQLK